MHSAVTLSTTALVLMSFGGIILSTALSIIALFLVVKKKRRAIGYGAWAVASGIYTWAYTTLLGLNPPEDAAAMFRVFVWVGIIGIIAGVSGSALVGLEKWMSKIAPPHGS